MHRNDNSTTALFQLKAQATQLQQTELAQGRPLTRARALEAVARLRGFKDWNTAAAACKQQPRAHEPGMPAPVAGWRDIDGELPKLPLRIHRAGDRTYRSIQELMRWARQLEMIADRIPEDGRSDALALIGGEVPYVFLNESTRWDDGLFHLCDRGYEEIDGIVLSREDLVETGVIAWDEYCGVHPGESYSVIHDEVRMSSDHTTIKQMARLLAAVALKADSLYGGRRLGGAA
jgi:hypothetical protein